MATSKRAMSVDDFTKLEVCSDPQFSPSGDGYGYVSTTIHEEEYRSQLYYQRLGEHTVKQWTFDQHKNSHPRFSPDGKKVVFQSNRSGVSQLWLMSLTGGEAKQLTFLKDGAYDPEWSQDGKYIIFTAPLEKDDRLHEQKEQTEEERKKEQEETKKQPLVVNRLNYKADVSGFLDQKKNQIILYDLENDSFQQLTTADVNHQYQDISPDGNVILFTANFNEDTADEPTNDLYSLHIHTKETTQLTRGKGIYDAARFSPSGDKIAFLGMGLQYAGATLTDLFVFDVKTGERTCISTQWDFSPGDAIISDIRYGESNTGPIWSKNEEQIFFIGTDHGATGLYATNLHGELQVLYEENNHVFGCSYDAHRENFILGMSSPTNPCDFYQLDKGKNVTKLTNVNASFLEEVELCEPEPLTFRTEDGWEIHGWLLRPYQFTEGKKYPLILEIHGGPHVMYGQTFFHELQLLAAKGYVVLYMNPRGSYGYGQKFVNACRHDYGGKDYKDIMCALDYALENYRFIDENRLGVTGGSYGGFMTNWIVGHTNRFKAAVTQRSISNWLSFYGVSDIGYFFTRWEHGLDLLDDPEKLWDFSPLKYAKNVETPLLILHGERDFRCPIEQAEQLFVTLKHLQKEVEFIRFPDANHEMSRSGKPQMRIERLHHICRWFEKYL
ncbi:MAG TPA: S9 family peptidase [Bacillota bacterium]